MFSLAILFILPTFVANAALKPGQNFSEKAVMAVYHGASSRSASNPYQADLQTIHIWLSKVYQETAPFLKEPIKGFVDGIINKKSRAFNQLQDAQKKHVLYQLMGFIAPSLRKVMQRMDTGSEWRIVDATGTTVLASMPKRQTPAPVRALLEDLKWIQGGNEVSVFIARDLKISGHQKILMKDEAKSHRGYNEFVRRFSPVA